jgi:hypothetical protein
MMRVYFPGLNDFFAAIRKDFKVANDAGFRRLCRIRSRDIGLLFASTEFDISETWSVFRVALTGIGFAGSASSRTLTTVPTRQEDER